MKACARRAALWMLVAVAGARAEAVPAPSHAIAAPEHVYVLGCDGRLHILKEGGAEPERVVSLSEKTRLIPRGNGSGGVVSGCATSGAVPLPAPHAFATLVQTSGDYDSAGEFHYRVLQFELPGLRLRSAVAVPGGFQDPPRLQPGADGSLRLKTPTTTLLLRQGQWTRILEAAPTDGLPPEHDGWATLPLTGYHTAGDAASTMPGSISIARMQHSGGAVLCKVVTRGTLNRAVVWPALRQILFFSGSDLAAAPQAVLAPGGNAVLVPQGGKSGAATLTLLNSRDGSVLARPKLRGTAAGIIPGGTLVGSDGEHYSLVTLGMTFPDVPVFDDTETYRPRVFVGP